MRGNRRHRSERENEMEKKIRMKAIKKIPSPP